MPYDILFELLSYLSAIEFSSLLSCCKPLHRYMREPSIWQRLSAHYGLRDTTYFHGLSFYILYTRLLHPYGPLIGLWASDYPYSGHIMEFRLLVGDEDEQGGIVGDAWDFSSSLAVHRIPRQPTYTRKLKIEFAVDGDGEGVSVTELEPPVALIRTYCRSTHRVGSKEHHDAMRHCAKLEVCPSSYQGHYLQHYRRTFPHPDFPSEDADWQDDERDSHRLKPCMPTTIDQREVVRIYPAVRLPIVFTAPTACLKPRSISFRCLDQGCTQFQSTSLPFDNLSPILLRYYPLKHLIQSGVDPSDAQWSLQTLAGLWLGCYGLSGTECLHLAWVEERDTLEAFKITGDVHVPRGARTWIIPAHFDGSHSLAADATRFESQSNIERLFVDTGFISERGFLDIRVRLLIGVTGADELQIWWDIINEVRRYIRYKGRDGMS
ncbi:uncharacterized protein LAESUDRAFT_643726 [Laetiporus sulphureus 93-53]|uniref:F-box domain-containing protein n=1 Tax=Laetiporus sulphureus 93-53 TaxID=1314785 RepID=A0A165GTQ7_9APHY|nr:uncharacterized protein LAESUDRAFT_643726 [Laetiporus sulphureus 93-53]KZT10802.1 hypothetical protein LAESUDRAFT_643726 [Laetiporus sulphureus 93-53]